MRFRIYQTNLDRDHDRITFQDLENLKQFQGSAAVNSAIYDMVYEREMDCSGLEEIYRIFNLEHPDDYTGRSLSVSDIVEVVEPPVQTAADATLLEPGFYFRRSIGFQKVEFQPELTQRSERTLRFEIDSDKVVRVKDILAVSPAVGYELLGFLTAGSLDCHLHLQRLPNCDLVLFQRSCSSLRLF